MNYSKYIYIITVIDLNEIYKIIYYEYILSFKVLDIIGVKRSQSFKTMDYKQSRVFGYLTFNEIVIKNLTQFKFKTIF